MDLRVIVSLILLVAVSIGGLSFLIGGEPENGNLLAAAAQFQGGGYNKSARIFNGTGETWCVALGMLQDCLGQYSPLPIMFGWNATWEKGRREAWANGPYDAALDVLVGGEKYRVTWSGFCMNGAVIDDGVCVWGEFVATGEDGADPTVGAGAAWFSAASPDRF